MGYWNPGFVPRKEAKFDWEEFAEQMYDYVARWQEGIEKRVKSLETTEMMADNELRETGAGLHNDIGRVREKLNDHLRIGHHNCGKCHHFCTVRITDDTSPVGGDAIFDVCAKGLHRGHEKFKLSPAQSDDEACLDFESKGESC